MEIYTEVLKMVKKENLELWERLNDLAESTSFTRRKYGRKTFIYADHELLNIDPIAGTRFPKSELCCEFLQVLDREYFLKLLKTSN